MLDINTKRRTDEYLKPGLAILSHLQANPYAQVTSEIYQVAQSKLGVLEQYRNTVAGRKPELQKIFGVWDAIAANMHMRIPQAAGLAEDKLQGMRDNILLRAQLQQQRDRDTNKVKPQ